MLRALCTWQRWIGVVRPNVAMTALDSAFAPSRTVGSSPRATRLSSRAYGERWPSINLDDLRRRDRARLPAPLARATVCWSSGSCRTADSCFGPIQDDLFERCAAIG